MSSSSSSPFGYRDSPLAGFVFHDLARFKPQYQVVKLLVPIGVKEQIDFESSQGQTSAAQAADVDAKADAERPAGGASRLPDAASSSSQWWLRDPDLSHFQRVDGVLQAPEPDPGAFTLRVYSLADVANRLDALQPPPGGFRNAGNKERDRDVFLRLKAKGPLRALASPAGWQARLARLQAIQPHFAEVIQFLGGCYAKAVASRRGVSIPPILLVGAPGVGKTHFSMELAKTLGVSCRRHEMDSADTSAALTGSHKTWGTTSVGLVFEEVCLGSFANPMIILDEIDKAAAHRYGNPLGPLHTLLESVSASNVRDISLDFEFNASGVIWVATANHLQDIPAPLRSRFDIFEIPLPTRDQALILARHLANAQVAAIGAHLRRPSEEVVQKLARLTPREMKKALDVAVGRALIANRRVIRASDLPVTREGGTRKVPIGFGTTHPCATPRGRAPNPPAGVLSAQE